MSNTAEPAQARRSRNRHLVRNRRSGGPGEQQSPQPETQADQLHQQLGNSLMNTSLLAAGSAGLSPSATAFAFADMNLLFGNSALSYAALQQPFAVDGSRESETSAETSTLNPEGDDSAAGLIDADSAVDYEFFDPLQVIADRPPGENESESAGGQATSNEVDQSYSDTVADRDDDLAAIEDGVITFEPLLITADPNATSESIDEVAVTQETDSAVDATPEAQGQAEPETQPDTEAPETDNEVAETIDQQIEALDDREDIIEDESATQDEEELAGVESVDEDSEEESKTDLAAAGQEVADSPEQPEEGDETTTTESAAEAESTELEVWRSQFGESIDQVPAPELRRAPQHPERIRSRGTATRTRQGAARGRIPQETQEALPETPSTVAPEPPETDPVPESTRLVVAESEHRLTDQTLPVLNRSPRETMPVLGTIPELPENPPPPGAEADQGQTTEPTPEQAQAEQSEQARSEGPATAVPEVAPQPETLTDEGPPPARPFPAPARAVVGDVVARLLSNTGDQAQAIVDDARSGMYEGQVTAEYPELGNESVDDVTTELDTQLRGIAAEAGLTEDALNEKITQYQLELQTQQQQADQDNAQTANETRQQTADENTETSSTIANAAGDATATINQNVEAANGEPDATQINAQRDRLIRGIQQQVALHSSNYEVTGRTRAARLRRFENQYINAYQRVGQIDTRAVLAELESESGEENWEHRFDRRYLDALSWPLTQITESQNTLRGDQRTAVDEATGFRTAVREAGAAAAELIRDWAAEETGEQRGWFTQLYEEMMDWSGQAQADVEMETARQNQQLGVSILSDLSKLETDIAAAGDDVNLETLEQRRDLTDRQKAIIRAYCTTTGDDRSRSLAAVAASLRFRIDAMHRPKIVEDIKKKLLEKPAGEWSKLSIIAQTEGGRFDPLQRARKLRGAMKGWGTNERRVQDALSNLTPLKHATLKKCYSSTYGRSLEADLHDELSGDDLVNAIKATGDKNQADAIALHEATAGKYFGTDEARVMQVLRNKTPEERRKINEEYRRLYNVDLRTDLDEDLNKTEMERADALIAGDTAKADAIGLDQALNGGWFGGDIEETDAIYQQIRRDVAQQHPDWTTAEVEAEILNRNTKVEETYNSEVASEDQTREGSALRAAMNDRLYGPERDLAYALAKNDLAKADAARIRIEEKSFYASDDAINAVLRGQYERAADQVRRDQMPAMQAALRQRMAERSQAGNPMTQDEIHAANRAMNREIEQSARIGGMANMKKLEDTFASEYPTWLGPGSLKAVIRLNMSGEDERIARDLVKQGGYMTPAQEMQYAIEGGGTDEDGMKDALRGRTAAEIEVITREYRQRTGRDLVTDIEEEFGWDAYDDDHDVERDLFDIRELMRGEPVTAEQRMQSLERKRDYERNAYGPVGNWLASEELAELELEYEDAKKRYERINDPNLSVEERNALQVRFEEQSELTLSAIEQVRQGVDEVADTLSTIAAVVAAVVVIVVAVIATVLTGGAAAPGLAGVLSAIGTVMTSASVAAAAAGAAAAATIATKYAVRGSDYSVEEMGIDVAVGVVDAAAAALTAGMGNALMRVGVLGRMGASNSMAVRVLANGLAEGIEGAASSMPSALASNLANERNWEGNPTANILGGTLIQTGMAVGLSGGLGALGGIAKPARGVDADDFIPDRALGRKMVDETGDVLARRGTPGERAALWADYQQINPGSRYSDFLSELDEGLIAREASDAAVRALQRNLRRDFLSNIPPAQRGPFAKTPIETLSDADFDRLTRGHDGPSAVIMRDGRPRVVMREGADPSSLRDLGRRLHQRVRAEGVRVSPDSPEALQSALPHDLRTRVPVEVDPDIPPRSVRVHYDIGADGLPANIRMRVGAGATAVDIDLHVQTVRKMQNLNGISGRLRVLFDRIADWMGRNGRPPIGSRAWEAKLELEKLPGVIRDRMRRLSRGGLTAAEHIDLESDIRHLTRQLESHAAALDEMDVDPGRGFVAAEGKPGRARTRTPRADTDAGASPETPRTHTPAIDANDVPEITPHGPQVPPPVSQPARIRELLAERGELANELSSVRREIEAQDRALHQMYLRNDREVEDWVARRASRGLSVDDLPDIYPARKLDFERAEARLTAAHARADRLTDTLDGLNAEYNQLTGRMPGGENRWRSLQRRGYADLGGDRPPCFPTGTVVKTPLGLRPIEKLRPGDDVLAYDAEQGSLIVRPVVKLHGNWTNRVVRLKVNEECVLATCSHPIWSVESQKWIAAHNLRAGGLLLTDTGATVSISSTRIDPMRTSTWNLEVADCHNFFVGRAGILVHNADESGWASPNRRATTIYAVFDGDDIIYVGKTFQGEPGDPLTRFGQHVADKQHWQSIQDRLKIRPLNGGNWTPFETAVWEQHFMNMYGGSIKQDPKTPLQNAIRAISEKNFNEFSQTKYGFQPC